MGNQVKESWRESSLYPHFPLQTLLWGALSPQLLAHLSHVCLRLSLLWLPENDT